MFPLAHIYHLGIPTTLALILNIEIILTLTIRTICLKLSYSPIVCNPIKTKPHSYTKIASPIESDLNKCMLKLELEKIFIQAQTFRNSCLHELGSKILERASLD